MKPSNHRISKVSTRSLLHTAYLFHKVVETLRNMSCQSVVKMRPRWEIPSKRANKEIAAIFSSRSSHQACLLFVLVSMQNYSDGPENPHWHESTVNHGLNLSSGLANVSIMQMRNRPNVLRMDALASLIRTALCRARWLVSNEHGDSNARRLIVRPTWIRESTKIVTVEYGVDHQAN